MSHNISHYLFQHAKRTPKKLAVIHHTGESITYEELSSRCNYFTKLFYHKGIRKGMTVATFIRPGLDFIPSIFALFQLQAIPVFIDPGMNLANIAKCIAKVQPKAMLGIPLAQIIKWIHPKSFVSIKYNIILSPFHSFFQKRIQLESEVPQEDDDQIEDKLAVVVFTSGST
ncbi:MAG: AMP-binding protein, partial [Candidatus Anammoxibacter sp.]